MSFKNINLRSYLQFSLMELNPKGRTRRRLSMFECFVNWTALKLIKNEFNFLSETLLLFSAFNDKLWTFQSKLEPLNSSKKTTQPWKKYHNPGAIVTLILTLKVFICTLFTSIAKLKYRQHLCVSLFGVEITKLPFLKEFQKVLKWIREIS